MGNLTFRFSAGAAIFSAALLFQVELLQGQELNHPLARAQSTLPQAALASGTVNVLAIMVQFQPDVDSLTSGNGQFVLSQSNGLDAPPHDKTFFENHLLFLQNYFRKVSGGKLNIDSITVLDSVITLPHQIKYYSPPKAGNGNNLGLLFQNSWHAADSIYNFSFPFNQYQCFVIFHAGSGRDIDFTTELGYDPLPYDIPSIYLNIQSLRNMPAPFGPGYSGEVVDNGSFVITNSIIMPESEDYPIVGLKLGTNGLLAASFGSFFGLPDLFDTETGVTGIGKFGLMDGQAIFAYGGIFPPEPSAWEKAYLGWATPIEVSPSTATKRQLYANETGKYSVLKVPISSTEYFLLENREGDANHDGENVTSYYNGSYSTTKITFANDTGYFDGSQIKNINGVVVDADEYDWALPQDTTYFGGILIWHIDEDVIDQNIATNTINANPAHRGVGLMEAHGANEIGNFIQTIFGAFIYDGSPYDFWYNGNPDRSSLQNVGGNNFTPTSLPNSNSYNGANSHVYITNFSSHDSSMTFYVTADSVAPNFQVTAGFPKNIHSATVNSSPLFGHVSSDGKLQVIANNGDSLYAFNVADGSSAGFDPTGFFSKVGGKFQPVVSSSGANDTLFAMDDSLFYGLVDQDNDHDGMADKLFATMSIGNAFSSQPLCRLGSKLIAIRYLSSGGTDIDLLDESGRYQSSLLLSGTATAGSESSEFAAIDTARFFFLLNGVSFVGQSASDSLQLVGVTGQSGLQPEPSHFPVPPFLSISNALLSPTGSLILIKLSSQGVYLDATGASPVKIFSVFPADTIVSGPVIADLDGDGNRDIIFATQTKIYAISYTGAVLNHFPISTVGSEVLSSDANNVVGSIVVADLDGDGKPEVIFGTKGGTLYAFTGATGQVFPGFPISIGGGLAGSPAVTYDSQTDDLYLAAIGLDGYLYDWTFSSPSPRPAMWGKAGQVLWGKLLNDNSHSNSIIEAPPPRTMPPSFSDTTSLMPKSQVYNWPNPVINGSTKIHFYLRDNAQVSISIYSFAGHKVADMQTNGTGGIANEVDWNASGVQSGVYFTRVEAVSSKTKDRKSVV